MAKILNHQNSHKLKAEAAAAAPSPVVVVEHHQRHRQQGAREERDGQAAVTYPQAHTTKIGLETFPQTFHCRNLQQKQPKKSHHESQPNDGQQQHGKGQQQQHCSHINTNTKQAQLLPQLTKTTTTTMQQKVPAQHLQAVAGKTNNNYKSIVEPASKTYNSTTMPSSSSASSSCSSSLAGPNSPSASSSPTSPSLYLPQLWPPSSTLYSNYSCCVLTYNLFAAYAEAATLQLKRKTSLTKLFYAASGWGWTTTGVRRHNDMSSICYLILMAFVYWGVMIRAAVATNLSSNTTSSSSSSASSSSSSVSSTTTLNTTLQHVSEISGNEEFALNSIAKLFVLNPKEIPQNTNHTADLITGNSVNSQMESLLPFLSFSSSSSSSASSSASSSSPVSPDILSNYQRRLLTRREAANVPDFEDDDSSYHDDEFDEYETLIRNKSAKGKYIGAPCNNMSCEPTLLHVTCDKETQICGCERGYPVQIGLTRGCDKPKKLGEMCFYDETCQFNDENSLCVQVRHNAMCQCVKGYHSVSLNKPTRRVFCTPDLDELNSDLPTLLGVCVGIGVLAGLICMVLHLFSKTKYPRHRNFGDANLPPPIMYSSETGSRRPSLASVHSTSSSVRSYSMMRFEKEQQQKEIRHEMKLRLARLQQQQQQQQLGQYKPQIIIGDTAMTMQQHGVALNRITMATPSPMTPNSTDELLPAVDENSEYPPTMEPQQTTTKTACPESVASATISAIKNATTGSQSTGASPKQTSTTTHNMTATGKAISAGPAPTAAATVASTDMANAAAYIGPCSSSTEAL